MTEKSLAIIASIPLIGTKYSNQTPLYSSVVEINASLDALPDDMRDLQDNLNNTASAIQGLNDKVDDLSENIDAINANVDEAKTVVNDYQELVQEAQDKTTRAITRIPHWVDLAAVAITLLLIWVILIQAGLLMYSLELTGWHFPRSKDPVAS